MHIHMSIGNSGALWKWAENKTLWSFNIYLVVSSANETDHLGSLWAEDPKQSRKKRKWENKRKKPRRESSETLHLMDWIGGKKSLVNNIKMRQRESACSFQPFPKWWFSIFTAFHPLPLYFTKDLSNAPWWQILSWRYNNEQVMISAHKYSRLGFSIWALLKF